MAQNKQRKSEAQKIFDEADNAGRFAGTDAESMAAKENAIEQIRQDSGSNAQERNKVDNRDVNDNQSQDKKGEAQNVNDDTERPMAPGETEHARNKANQGQQEQGRH